MLHKVSWVAESLSSLLSFIYCWSEPVVSISPYNSLMEGLVSTVAWLMAPYMISPFSGVIWANPVFMFSHVNATLFHSSASGLFYEPMKISAAFLTLRKKNRKKKRKKTKQTRSQRCTTLSFLAKGLSSNIIQPNKLSFIPFYTYLQDVSSSFRSYWPGRLH